MILFLNCYTIKKRQASCSSPCSSAITDILRTEFYSFSDELKLIAHDLIYHFRFSLATMQKREQTRKKQGRIIRPQTVTLFILGHAYTKSPQAEIIARQNIKTQVFGRIDIQVTTVPIECFSLMPVHFEIYASVTLLGYYYI